ncbi:MAG: hypothetical protein MI861_04805, partial [Pirellulales bacterium]|nr:hypothetical protein [Pirellulales bacterium]
MAANLLSDSDFVGAVVLAGSVPPPEAYAEVRSIQRESTAQTITFEPDVRFDARFDVDSIDVVLGESPGNHLGSLPGLRGELVRYDSVAADGQILGTSFGLSAVVPAGVDRLQNRESGLIGLEQPGRAARLGELTFVSFSTLDRATLFPATGNVIIGQSSVGSVLVP